MDEDDLAWSLAASAAAVAAAGLAKRVLAGPRGEEHLAAYIAAAGDVVTEVMYSRFPGVPAGGELGRTWGQALAGMTHHVADRWVRAPWAPKEDVAHSLTRLVLPALEHSLHERSTPP
mgnify:CR=1 FL=1